VLAIRCECACLVVCRAEDICVHVVSGRVCVCFGRASFRDLHACAHVRMRGDPRSSPRKRASCCCRCYASSRQLSGSPRACRANNRADLASVSLRARSGDGDDRWIRRSIRVPRCYFPSLFLSLSLSLFFVPTHSLHTLRFSCLSPAPCHSLRRDDIRTVVRRKADTKDGKSDQAVPGNPAIRDE